MHADLVDSAVSEADGKVRTAASQLRAGRTPDDVSAAVPGVAVRIRTPVAVATAESVTSLEEADGAPAAQVPTRKGILTVRAEPDLMPARRALTTMLWIAIPGMVVLTLLLAALTWYAMGRALRPVESIRAEFSEISALDLQRRVPVPASEDEVAALAGTMNATLDHLQRAVNRLRTFTSDASHELRGPLTTLHARLELALAAGPAHSDWVSTGKEALRDAARLEEIVQDLLFLARLDARAASSRSQLNVFELIRDLVSRQYSKCLVFVDASPSAVDVEVVGDSSSLTRLIVNLIDNASRHARTLTSVEMYVEASTLVIEVVDDGAGIPEGERERVFGRFTRLDDARSRSDGGTGLGLAIARDIAVSHGGSLTACEPKPERSGARMVAKLPIPSV
ncbi:sensor histidine kinase [Streptomyces sp. NPDC059215]|uniref:sensor histidine kinase n=1 Tax=Streptomyces sp. NPDC059215 TaxID=3346772 RepID=UPI00369896B9